MAQVNRFQDIGGGWPLDSGHEAALSHVPLVWMVREAQKAGLEFDEEKLTALNCCHEEKASDGLKPQTIIPAIEIDPASPDPTMGQSNGDSNTNSVATDF